ncbi:Ig-like domain-containing protein [Archangium violaceum]|uniref:Ig-like domain-containing protein n=1 Tax=Archangium violaceum TaxID=83451 RepID=UPI002B2B6FEA|nr:Ig-like domain-containing protein [Archangium gephyra]
MRLNKASLCLTTLLVLAGCPGPEAKSQLSTVTVTCAPAAVQAGQTTQCTASAMDQDGKPFTVSGFSWASSNESVATVDSAGKVTTTLSSGTTNISASATADGVTQQGQLTLSVTPYTPQLSAITVTCAATSVPASRPTQCTASATDQGGKPFTVSSYTWTSQNESVAKVGPTGKVTTFTAGTATLGASATEGGVTRQGQASLTVTEAQPTLHSTSIAASETWRASENPHVVSGFLEVTGASTPTLTLEEGVELRFNSEAELRVSAGALRAQGTAEMPIRMVANQSAPTKGYWRGLVFATAGSSSELNHVTLSGCGHNAGEGACIAVKNEAAPVLRHVAVLDSDSTGVLVADDGSAFGAGSTMLSISATGYYAIHIGANQAGTLPTGGTFTDNEFNAVELWGTVSRSQSWPNLGIPYVANDNVYVAGSTSPALSLSAGTVLRFRSDSGLYVGIDEPGGLLVEGTPAAPVRFTADADSPLPGHWRGVHLHKQTSKNTRLTHATIEFAGAAGTSSSWGTGGLNVYGDFSPDGVRPVLDNVVVQNGSEYGFFLVEDAGFGSGSSGLTARNNDGYALSMEANRAGTIPTSTTFSGNSRNAVELTSGTVNTTQTWPNLGAPYVLAENLSVGFTSHPALTLLPGTELRFAAGTGVFVGFSLPGTLVAEGTAAAPIRFVPDEATPTKGYWHGTHFSQAEGSKLDHVIVTHAGAVDPSIPGTGNLNVHREIGAFVTNSTFSDSSGCGITVSDGTRSGTTAVTTDFTLPAYNNTLTGNTGGGQCTN